MSFAGQSVGVEGVRGLLRVSSHEHVVVVAVKGTANAEVVLRAGALHAEGRHVSLLVSLSHIVRGDCKLVSEVRLFASTLSLIEIAIYA